MAQVKTSFQEDQKLQ
jgi:hypothetical protein